MTDETLETLAQKRRRQAEKAEQCGDDWTGAVLRNDAAAIETRDARIAELEAQLDEQEMFEGEALQGHDTQETRAEAAEAECGRLRETMSALLTDITEMFADADSLEMSAYLARQGRPAITESIGPKTVRDARTALAADQQNEREDDSESAMKQDIHWRGYDAGWNAALNQAAHLPGLYLEICGGTGEWTGHASTVETGDPWEQKYVRAEKILGFKRGTS